MVAAIVFFMGASLGSFVNVVADRLPAGGSLVRPPSHCPVCHTHLRPLDLVPILSYLWLRGRCRYCGAVIPARLAVVEALSGLLLLLIFWRYGLGPGFAVVALIATLLLAIAIIDLEHGLILNRIVLPAAAAAVVLAPLWPAEVGSVP